MALAVVPKHCCALLPPIRKYARPDLMPTLFDPIRIGDLDLPNRVIMAPLTRSRAVGGKRVPNALMAEYYVQRASAGLIISEATAVTPQGVGYADTPGIWTDEQVAGWKHVTDAVHAAGGRIFMQLWHVGRISDPIFLDGELPVAPSAIAAQGHVSLVRPKRAYVTPRALETEEIAGVIAAYRHGAENAKKAGFDGVEIHGANGYLLDQFLQDSTNQRTDAYGGPIENRARLLLEITDACIDVWGADRVGVHLSPRGDVHSMGDSDLAATFGYVARELGKRRIAFICAREALGDNRLGPALKAAFGGVYIANEKMTKQTAEHVLAAGEADAVAFGQLFIANPDLPRRLALDASLNEPRPETFYHPGAEGYTDYPALV
uniref:NADH:flavin oxidoreductase/NADH oxidase n=2 Tax=Cupriavidus TaxID=106589 RepID=Q46TW4_CUPPJ